MLLTANGVSFNWNKHNVMEHVRWLPLWLRGGMAAMDGRSDRERGVRCENQDFVSPSHHKFKIEIKTWLLL